MFIDINYNKRPQKARLHLAKPNKEVIAHLSEKFQDSLALKLGNINELSFSIPHYIEDDNTNEYVRNPHIESVREKMLIKVTLSTYTEWFVIDSIEEDGDDSDTFNVTAFSLGYELRGKRISGFTTESMNATEIASELLSETVWTIKEIDPMFDGMFRSFESGDDSNVLEAIIQWSETFGGLIVWHSDERQISLLNMAENGKYKGLSIDYGRYLRSIKRTRTTDDMPTRLYVYGSEDLGIASANPTGMPYLEDFSHYMYPFQRDEDKNVIEKSHFMSDDLCHALLDHQLLVGNNAPMIAEISGQVAEKTTTLTMSQMALDELELELETILALLDMAQATEDTALIAQRKDERNAKESEVQAKMLEVQVLKTDLFELEGQLETLQKDISNQANFTDELLYELNLYIHSATWRDDRYIDVQELYEDGLKHFNKIRQPKVVIEVTMDNLMNIVEEQYYWDKLVLGDLIKVKYPQMNIEYMAKIIEINYDLEAGEANLIIANTQDLLNDTEKFTQLLYGSQSASTLVQNNKYKWDKVNAIEKEVSNLISSAWDANKNKIIAGVNNSIEIGNRGMIVRNPSFPDEILIVQSGIIALSKDGGETWKSAMTPDGIIAERLVGQVIAGEELMITNSSGSFTLDQNGAVFNVDSFEIRSSGGGGNLIDRWQQHSDFIDEYRDDNLITAYEKKMLNIKWNDILSRYISNSNKINGYYEDGGVSKQFVTDYHNRYEELYDYLFVTPHGEKPMLAEDNLAYTTRIVGSEFDTKFRNYDSALVTLEEQLSLQAVGLAEKAITNAENAQKNIDEVMNDVVWKIELSSSNGLTFKNNNINTVITARVYRGKDDVTATLPLNGFIWRKYDKNGAENTAWGVSKEGIGNTIQVTESDIQEKATFNCDIFIV